MNKTHPLVQMNREEQQTVWLWIRPANFLRPCRKEKNKLKAETTERVYGVRRYKSCGDLRQPRFEGIHEICVCYQRDMRSLSAPTLFVEIWLFTDNCLSLQIKKIVGIKTAKKKKKVAKPVTKPMVEIFLFQRCSSAE